MAAFVFDFDGTLVDSEPLHEAALAQTLRPLGLEVSPGSFVGLPDADAIRTAFAEARRDLPESRLRELLETKSAAAMRLWEAGRAAPYPGAVELVRALHRLGLDVAVCTAALRREVEPVLEQLGILPLLRCVTTADDVAASKPDPACYLLTASRLEVSPERCVAIEDSHAGVSAAAAAGCRVVAVGHTTPRERLSAAHRYVESIDRLNVETVRGMLGP